MGLWGYGFTRESKRARATRRYAVTGWFIKRAIPITYPPESNPRVISRIYHDKSDGNNQKSKE